MRFEYRRPYQTFTKWLITLSSIFALTWSNLFDLILFLQSDLCALIRPTQIWSIYSDMILFNPIWYNLIQSDPIWSILFDPLTPL